MTEEPEFLRRWSRRKLAANRDRSSAETNHAGAPQPMSEAPQTAVAPGDTEGSKPAEAEPEDLDLPEIDSLTESSDFTVFMKDGVPRELRNRALRKLWRLNPVFANLDGLNDYDQDFTDAATVVENLKSLYQVGRGFAPKDEQPSDDAETPAEFAADSTDTGGATDTESPAEETLDDLDSDPIPDGNKIS